ncbi:unnamed protein product, partial [Amoebophrya sp. A120]
VGRPGGAIASVRTSEAVAPHGRQTWPGVCFIVTAGGRAWRMAGSLCAPSDWGAAPCLWPCGARGGRIVWA